jgi:tetratricopeptide (TPR) repeat protein
VGEGPATAAGQFRLAGEAYRRGDFAAAKKHYVHARELDLLRFRAPEAMNRVIRKLAGRYPNAELVDAQALFEVHSPHGILGRETLLEHVHPNLYGYALLSEAFYGALKRRKLVAVPPGREMSFARLRTDMPVTQVDSLKGAYEIMMLKEGWPFNEPMPAEKERPKSFEAQLAGGLAVKQFSWSEAMVRLQSHYLREKREAEARRVAEALLLEYPYDPAHYNQAGKLCTNLGENEKAAFYLKKSFGLENAPETARNLCITLLKLDRPEEARTYLDYAAAHAPSPSLAQLKGLVSRVIELKAAYGRDTGNVVLSNGIAAAYLAFANTTAARRYVAHSLRREPTNVEAAALLSRLEAIEK